MTEWLARAAEHDHVKAPVCAERGVRRAHVADVQRDGMSLREVAHEAVECDAWQIHPHRHPHASRAQAERGAAATAA